MLERIVPTDNTTDNKNNINKNNTIKNNENMRQRGSKAEDMAVEMLVSKGFQIVKRNFFFGRSGEIDIIAKDGDTLVFVEVKARTSKAYGDPLFSITYSKQNSIRRCAEGYLYINKIRDIECRFDVITIDLSQKPPLMNHLINAF